MSPLTTPLSMMSALRFGRYRLAIAWIVTRHDDQRELAPIGDEIAAEESHGATDGPSLRGTWPWAASSADP